MIKTRNAIVLNIFLPLFLTQTGVWAQSAEAIWRRADTTYLAQPALSLRLYQQAKRMALDQRRLDMAANICVDEATLYYVSYNDYDQAVRACRTGLALHPVADSTRFKLWASLGEMYHAKTQSDSAGRYWELAQNLLENQPKLEQQAPAYVAAFWGNRGNEAVEQHDYQLANQFYQKRLEFYKQRDNPIRQAIAENQFAYFYLKTGNLLRADSLFYQAVRHYPARLNDLSMGWFLLGLIDCRIQQKRIDTDALLPLLTQTRRIAQTAGAHGRELYGYLALAYGRYYVLLGQAHHARQWLERSMTLARPLPHAWLLLWQNQMALSRWYQRWGTLPQSLWWAQQAIQIVCLDFQEVDLGHNPKIGQFLDGPKLAESLYWKAQLLHQATDLPHHLMLADQTYERALALSDYLQAAYSSDLTRLFVQTQLRPALEDALQVAYERYREHHTATTQMTLWRRQEQASAAVLLSTGQRERQFPAPKRAAWKQARDRLSAAKTALAGQPNAPLTSPMRAELINAELAWSRQQQQTAGLTKYSVQPPPTVLHRALMQQLDAQTAFLHYSLMTNSLLLTLTTRHGTLVRCLSISRVQLTERCLRLRHEVYRNPDPFKYTGQADAHALFNALLRPVWAELRTVKRLVIVRDGSMHHLPFEVLTVSNRRADDYLLRYVAITYAYSVAGYVAMHRPLAGTSPSMLSIAPFIPGAPSRAGAGTYRPLPGSDYETDGIEGTHVTGGNASKALFLELLPRHHLLHLATHAEANHTDYEASYVAFSPVEADHRLYAHEIAGLSLVQVRLTTLSACRSGSGSLQAGEGLMGLAWAFAAAGCPQTVASLWNAHNETTTTLTTYFYNELRQGTPTDVALQRAKLRFLAEQPVGGAYTPPHFWAHLILIGHNQPVYPPPSPFPTNWGWVAIVVAIGSATILSSGRAGGWGRWMRRVW